MGMFDHVRSQIALPDGFTGQMQCKDFDCQLAMVEIREDGSLWIERFEHEIVPLAERPYPDADDWRAGIGMLRRINERWEQIPFDGEMNFYGGNGDYWHEYFAQFTDGKLVSIRTITERNR